MYCQRESQGCLHGAMTPGIHQNDDLTNEEEEGWGRMSPVEGAQPSLGVGWEWMSGETGLGKQVGSWGVRCIISGNKRVNNGNSQLGTEGLSRRGSRSTTSRDQVNLPSEMAGRCQRQE